MGQHPPRVPWRLPVCIIALLLAGAVAGLSIDLATAVRPATAAPPPGSLPPTKRAIEDRTVAQRATAIARRIPKEGANVAPPPRAPNPSPTATPRTGLLGSFGNNCTFPSSVALLDSVWQDIVAGEFVKVCAGWLKSAPDQGLVVVMTGAPGQRDLTIQQYLGPVRAGSLRITAVAGRRFALAARNGATLTFDLDARAFIGAATDATGPLVAAPSPAPSRDPAPRRSLPHAGAGPAD
jgi:hypothetical protein